MNNPIKLLTIKRILRRTNYYEIHFDNKYSLAATSLHAFTVVRNGDSSWLPTNELSTGDQIWVDVRAFGADGSYRTKHLSPRG